MLKLKDLVTVYVNKKNNQMNLHLRKHVMNKNWLTPEDILNTKIKTPKKK